MQAQVFWFDGKKQKVLHQECNVWGNPVIFGNRYGILNIIDSSSSTTTNR
jgi:hypothetical protein